MNILKSNPALAIGLGLCVACGLALVVRPAYLSARALEAEIDAKRTELTRPGSGPQTIERLAHQLIALRALGKERMTPIPEDSGVAALVRSLSESFDDLGLNDREVSTGAAKQLDEASSLPMTIALIGGFPAIHSALARIESLDRLVRVQRLRVAGEGKSRDGFDRSGRVRADIQLDVFYAPKQVSAASPAAGNGGER